MSKINQRKIELLKILAEGCRKHPAYRARRPATGRCEECMIVWKARLQLQRSTQGMTFQWRLPRIAYRPKTLKRANDDGSESWVVGYSSSVHCWWREYCLYILGWFLVDVVNSFIWNRCVKLSNWNYQKMLCSIGFSKQWLDSTSDPH